MLFKCPLCFKRHWTTSGRNKCQQRHERISRLSQRGPGFGVLPEKAPIPYYPTEVPGQPKPSMMDTVGNFATGYLTADLLNDLTEKTTTTEQQEEPAPKKEYSFEPAQEEPKSSYTPPAPAEDQSSSLGGYSSLGGSSSLDGYSSLDSSSSSDSWSSSSDW